MGPVLMASDLGSTDDETSADFDPIVLIMAVVSGCVFITVLFSCVCCSRRSRRSGRGSMSSSRRDTVVLEDLLSKPPLADPDSFFSEAMLDEKTTSNVIEYSSNSDGSVVSASQVSELPTSELVNRDCGQANAHISDKKGKSEKNKRSKNFQTLMLNNELKYDNRPPGDHDHDSATENNAKTIVNDTQPARHRIEESLSKNAAQVENINEMKLKVGKNTLLVRKLKKTENKEKKKTLEVEVMDDCVSSESFSSSTRGSICHDMASSVNVLRLPRQSIIMADFSSDGMTDRQERTALPKLREIPPTPIGISEAPFSNVGHESTEEKAQAIKESPEQTISHNTFTVNELVQDSEKTSTDVNSQSPYSVEIRPRVEDLTSHKADATQPIHSGHGKTHNGQSNGRMPERISLNVQIDFHFSDNTSYCGNQTRSYLVCSPVTVSQDRRGTPPNCLNAITTSDNMPTRPNASTASDNMSTRNPGQLSDVPVNDAFGIIPDIKIEDFDDEVTDEGKDHEEDLPDSSESKCLAEENESQVSDESDESSNSQEMSDCKIPQSKRLSLPVDLDNRAKGSELENQKKRFTIACVLDLEVILEEMRSRQLQPNYSLFLTTATADTDREKGLVDQSKEQCSTLAADVPQHPQISPSSHAAGSGEQESQGEHDEDSDVSASPFIPPEREFELRLDEEDSVADKGHIEQLDKGHREQLDKGHMEQPDKGKSELPDKGHAEQPDKRHMEQPDKGHTEQPDKEHTEQPDKRHAEQPDKRHTEQPDKGHTEQPDKGQTEQLDQTATQIVEVDETKTDAITSTTNAGNKDDQKVFDCKATRSSLQSNGMVSVTSQETSIKYQDIVIDTKSEGRTCLGVAETDERQTKQTDSAFERAAEQEQAERNDERLTEDSDSSHNARNIQLPKEAHQHYQRYEELKQVESGVEQILVGRDINLTERDRNADEHVVTETIPDKERMCDGEDKDVEKESEINSKHGNRKDSSDGKSIKVVEAVDFKVQIKQAVIPVSNQTIPRVESRDLGQAETTMPCKDDVVKRTKNVPGEEITLLKEYQRPMKQSSLHRRGLYIEQNQKGKHEGTGELHRIQTLQGTEHRHQRQTASVDTHKDQWERKRELVDGQMGQASADNVASVPRASLKGSAVVPSPSGLQNLPPMTQQMRSPVADPINQCTASTDKPRMKGILMNRSPEMKYKEYTEKKDTEPPYSSSNSNINADGATGGQVGNGQQKIVPQLVVSKEINAGGRSSDTRLEYVRGKLSPQLSLLPTTTDDTSYASDESDYDNPWDSLDEAVKRGSMRYNRRSSRIQDGDETKTLMLKSAEDLGRLLEDAERRRQMRQNAARSSCQITDAHPSSPPPTFTRLSPFRHTVKGLVSHGSPKDAPEDNFKTHNLKGKKGQKSKDDLSHDFSRGIDPNRSKTVSTGDRSNIYSPETKKRKGLLHRK